MMRAIGEIVAAIVEYFVDAMQRRRDHKDSRLGELEELQQAASGDDEASERKFQEIWTRMRNRRRVGGDDERV